MVIQSPYPRALPKFASYASMSSAGRPVSLHDVEEMVDMAGTNVKQNRGLDL